MATAQDCLNRCGRKTTARYGVCLACQNAVHAQNQRDPGEVARHRAAKVWELKEEIRLMRWRDVQFRRWA